MSSIFSKFAAMKRLLILAVAAALSMGAAAQNAQQRYIETYSQLAVSEMARTGVPASITLAQGLLESSAGQSLLAVKANNHFGLKCHGEWTGETFYKDDDKEQECFRAYPTAEDSFVAHSDFLRTRDRYQSLFELDPTDYKAWARGLKKAGYATDARYANKLIGFIEDFQLYRYDEAGLALINAPEAPVRVAADLPRVAPVEEHRIPAAAESVKISLTRNAGERNGVPFVYAVEGDSYASLAKSNHLFKKEILRYNDLQYDRELEPGTIVYLGRKKAQAEAGKYLVEQQSLTLWEASQLFGVQLKKLRLYNILHGDGPFRPGETVYLRKP